MTVESVMDTDGPVQSVASILGVREFVMVTFLARIRIAKHPEASTRLRTAPAVVMVHGPVYVVRVVPAGTPVLVALGKADGGEVVVVGGGVVVVGGGGGVVVVGGGGAVVVVGGGVVVVVVGGGVTVAPPVAK